MENGLCVLERKERIFTLSSTAGTCRQSESECNSCSEGSIPADRYVCVGRTSSPGQIIQLTLTPFFSHPSFSPFLSLSHLSAEIPALPPPQQDPSPVDQDPDMDEWNEPSTPNKFKKTSGPRTQSPYSSDESWFMPITIAIAVFLPILFCMCRVR